MMHRPPTLAPHGMVAASHPLAAEAGVAALRAGGHAVDAAIAAAAVLSVVEPGASGLGGDGFLLVWDEKDQAVSAINSGGTAPSRLTPDLFRGHAAIPVRNPLATGVPGCVAAWGEAHYGWGRLPWDRLFQDAIRLAGEGFPVSCRLAQVLRRELPVLQADPGLAQLFLHEDRSPLAAGEICRPQTLARTLAVLAEEEAEGFYNGEIAQKLAAGVKARGGVLSEEDLAGQESQLLQPLEYTPGGAGGWTLLAQPLPTQGILLPLMLGLLSALDPGPPWQELHRQSQAARIGLIVRMLFLTDPHDLPLAEAELTGFLLDAKTHAALAALLDTDPIPPMEGPAVILRSLEQSGPAGAAVMRAYRDRGFLQEAPAGPTPGPDTTYLCAADEEGNVAGLIQSVFHRFGCGFLEPETGIILNSRASAFSLDPGRVNHLRPGKRTLHTLNSYMLLKHGRPWMAAGTPGADQQVQTNLQVVRHMLLGRPLWPGPAPMLPMKWTQARMPGRGGDAAARETPEFLAAALEAPRWEVHPDGQLRLESRFPADISGRMRKLGHECARIGPWEGSGFVQAIRKMESGAWLGATDPRGEGAALGQ